MTDILSILQGMGYLGAFLVSLLGTLTVIFPIPYLIVIYLMGASQNYNPILLGLIGGLGATFGEITLYVLARVGRLALSEERKRKLEFFGELIRKYGAILVFIFAATPLPDDILYPILGLIRYDVTYVFLACFAGKALLTGGVAYAGELSIEILGILIGEGNIITQVILLILIIISVYIVLKVDWEEVFKRFMGGRGK